MRSIETKQGYKVVETFYTEDNHVILIVDKGKTGPYGGRYVIYEDYDWRTGLHTREIVPFSSMDEAERYVRKYYHVIDNHSGAIHPKRLTYRELANMYDIVAVRHTRCCIFNTWYNGYEYKILNNGFPLTYAEKEALRRYSNVSVYTTCLEYAPEQKSTCVFIAGSICKNQ